MTAPIRLQVSELKVPLKVPFRHASARRVTGESLWVEASRGAHRGYGEGCPRPYVTGETRASCVEWLTRWQEEIASACSTLDGLRGWLAQHDDVVDKSPSAWCAIECALLDLFAREADRSVEALLGLPGPGGPCVYSAVLGDDEPWKTRLLVDEYCVLGLTDFKVKLGGDLDVDRRKLRSVVDGAAEHGMGRPRVRVDANNLWATEPERATEYLRALDLELYAVEEPVRARDVESQSRISVALGLPIILDESLCTMADLGLYAPAPGRFIANLKVSRVGGVLRGLRLIEAVRARGWPIVVGAHVGETSVLTRAAMILARAAGDLLTAREGAFGVRLLEREPASPSLRWGAGGILDLSRGYAELTEDGFRVTPPDAWSRGWGLTCRTARRARSVSEAVDVHAMSDGHGVHARRWGPEDGSDVLVVLHGATSHSGWQRPFADAIRTRSGPSVFAPDRRGCGLDRARGDLGVGGKAVEDVVDHVEWLARRFERVHLAGWSDGALHAALAAQRLRDDRRLATLVLIAPAVSWSARGRAAFETTRRVVQSVIARFGVTPGRDDAFVPVPFQGADLAASPEGLDFIEADELRTTAMTLRSLVVMEDVQERSWETFRDLRLPVLGVLATRDRAVDNAAAEQGLRPWLESPGNRLAQLDAGHAVQLDRPDELATVVLEFIRSHGANDARADANRRA